MLPPHSADNKDAAVFALPDEISPPPTPSRSDEEFRLLVDRTTGYAMFLMDTRGCITSWNEGARRIFGYDDGEVLGQPADQIFTPEDRESGVPERELATAAREGVAADVRWHQRKDGSRFWADGILERLTSEAGDFKGFAKVLRDATRDKENAQRLADSQEQYRTLFESVDVGFCVIEVLFDSQGRPSDYRFLEVNPAFERHTGLMDGVGKTVRTLVPDLDDFWFRTYGSVAQTGEPVRFESHAPALERWFDVYALRVGPAEDHHVALFFTDITARKEAQETLRRSEDQLRDAQTRLESALSAGEIATWTYDVENNRMAADANLARLFSVAAASAAAGDFGVYLQAIHDEDRARVAETIGAAMAQKNDYEAEFRVVLPDGSHRWLVTRGKVERNADGRAVSLPGVVVNITERVTRERREKFLYELTAQARALLDPDEILYETAKAVGEYLHVHRCLYIEINEEANTLSVRRDFTQGEGITSFAGTHPLSAFGTPIVDSLRAGNITQSVDTETDARLSEENKAIFRATHFRAFLSVPLHRAGRWVAVLAVHYAHARTWTQEEAELLSAVAERTWLAVENAHLFRETRARAEREALLNQIGAAVRTLQEPDAILQAVVSLLGQGFAADRCYFVRYDLARDTAHVFPEWFRPEAGVEPLAGRTLQMSSYSVDRDVAYKSGRTHVVNDVVAYAPEDAAPLLAVNVRAILRVPIAVGNQMTAVAVAMAHEPRAWTSDEVRLIENVATLLRSSLESAHTQQRERNIAQQLQDALVPPAPRDLPGLALASHYRPALDEAGVGGDFFDVFEVDTGCTALVVADLSGKGLDAASQVATVRNMLRYALYKGSTVAEAVTALHETLVQHTILTGFATLFVGSYDHAERTLTYVNCGQEPGLLWRAATGAVEMLGATGPVLGGFAADDFASVTVTLHDGDVLALFTDGLTEVGPHRKNLLEIEGVSEILSDCCASGAQADNPASLLTHLLTQVDSFATGGIRDDIALLVGVVTPRGEVGTVK